MQRHEVACPCGGEAVKAYVLQIGPEVSLVFRCTNCGKWGFMTVSPGVDWDLPAWSDEPSFLELERIIQGQGHKE